MQIFTMMVLILLNINTYAKKCPKCGKGTKYPQCFSIEYVKKKLSSAINGCSELNSSFSIKTAGNKNLSYQKKLEEKLMIEFCEDPINNLGTACEKFHYSRVNKQ